MMIFSRGAHESDIALHLAAAQVMLPYLFASGCHNYARYGTFYVQRMKSLPTPILNRLLKDCSLRHIPGVNKWCVDRYVHREHDMKLGHGPGGAVGLATSQRQMVQWTLSFAICGELTADLQRLIATDSAPIQ